MDMVWLHSRYAEALGWSLVHSLWELTVIAGAVALALVLARKRSANLRYVIACAGLLAMAGVPAGTFFLSLPPARMASLAVPGGDASAGETLMFAGEHRPIQFPAQAAALLPALPLRARLEAAVRPWLRDAVLIYLLGAAIFSLRLAAGYRRLRNIVRHGTPVLGDAHATLKALEVRLGMARAVGLLESALVEVPTVIGALRPVILLPACALTGLSPAQLSAILAHELAHIRRHDYPANLVQSAFETLLFYHPAVWWLSARIRQERENCCDDAAVEVTGDRISYARALAAMESLRAAPAGVPAHLAVASRSGVLMPRIRRLLPAATPVRPRRYLTIPAAVFILSLLGGLTYVGCTRSAETTPNPAATAATKPAVQATENQTAIPAESPPKPRSPADRDRIVLGKLEQAVPAFVSHNQPLEQTISRLSNSMGSNIYVEWRALETAGIDKTTPVDIDLRDVSYRKVLVTLLAQVGGGVANLGYTIDDGLLTISTKEDLASARYQIIRVYDIRDLLVIPNHIPSPQLRAPDAGQGVFGDGAAPPHDQQRQEVVSSLMDTIKATVAPDSWRDAGGAVGTIRELNGQLIINQTSDNQRAILALIQKLREGRGIQVAVEARLFLVDDELAKSLSLPQTAADANGVVQNILDEDKLPALLQRLESDRGTVMVTAPRVTFFNGQDGFIASTNQQNYIAGCKTRKDDAGKIVPDYDIQTFTSGLVLNFGATVSADRRSVALKIHPLLRELEKMETFHAPDMPAGDDFILQKPVTHETEFTASANIPDGKVLILTGAKYAGKLPESGRGFTASGQSGGSPKQLLLLIRPSVIIHREIETDLFN